MRTTLAALLLLTMSLWTVAMAHDRRSDEDHVRSLDDQERIAALKRDIPALERLWSEEFIVNAPNNQVVVGRRAVLETFPEDETLQRGRGTRQVPTSAGDEAAQQHASRSLAER